MLRPAVGGRLDQRRSAAFARALDRGGGDPVHVGDVVAVGRLARHAVGGGPPRDALDGARLAPLGGQRYLVVLAHEDDRQLPYGGEIEGLVNEALVDRPVTEERHRDLPAAADLRAERRAAADRKTRANDAVAAEHAKLDIGDVHRAAEAAAVAARLAHQLRHHAPDIAALRDHVSVAAVMADDVVARQQGRCRADCDRLLPDAAVRGACDHAGGERARPSAPRSAGSGTARGRPRSAHPARATERHPSPRHSRVMH